MAEIKDLKAYVLVNPHNNRLTDNKIQNYPECLEDDVAFDPNFNEYYQNFIKMVPDDWDAIYFGGMPTEDAPIEVSPNVLRPGCIVGLECTILRNSMARYLLGVLTFSGRKRITQVDVTLAHLSKGKVIKVYMPVIKIAHQVAGYSAHFNKVDTDRNSGSFRYFDYIDINGEKRHNSDEDLKRYESVRISKPEE